jgi:hypothetical protein
MEAGDLERHQIIESVMARLAENGADAAAVMWEQIAAQIISIVGEGGFAALYVRSLSLTQSSFPWLAGDLLSPQTGHRFAELKKCLESQEPAQASEANRLLVATFTDILALLIGEELTITIMRSAWGNEPPDRTGKENKIA